MVLARSRSANEPHASPHLIQLLLNLQSPVLWRGQNNTKHRAKSCVEEEGGIFLLHGDDQQKV